MFSDTIHAENVLPYQNDRYDGVVVDAAHLPASLEDFSLQLTSSLEEWRKLNRRGVWLRIPIDKSHFIASAVSSGFVFHHAEKDYLMLTHWLSESEENHLPPNASHQVGVGCVVVSPDNKLLLVQERNGPLKGTGVWKLPTGLLEAGEDIPEAACREVLEETGVHTEFVSLLCFRQAHGVQFGKSDLFFVCVLRPTSFDINHQVSEITACEWLEPEAFFDQAFFKGSALFTEINRLIQEEIKGEGKEEGGTQSSSFRRRTYELGWRPGQHTLYFPTREDEKDAPTPE